jgi:hypothetical protein
MLDKVGSARQQILDNPQVLTLPILGHMPLYAAPKLVEPRKPRQRDRNGGQPAQVHDEGSPLTEIGGGTAVEDKQTRWPNWLCSWLACGIRD